MHTPAPHARKSGQDALHYPNAEVRATSNEGRGVLEFIEKNSGVERLEPDPIIPPRVGEKIVKMDS